jgi:hypothetical protein
MRLPSCSLYSFKETGVRCELDLSDFEYSQIVFPVGSHSIPHSTVRGYFQLATGPHYILLLGGVSC